MKYCDSGEYESLSFPGLQRRLAIPREKILLNSHSDKNIMSYSRYSNLYAVVERTLATFK